MERRMCLLIVSGLAVLAMVTTSPTRVKRHAQSAVEQSRSSKEHKSEIEHHEEGHKVLEDPVAEHKDLVGHNTDDHDVDFPVAEHRLRIYHDDEEYDPGHLKMEHHETGDHEMEQMVLLNHIDDKLDELIHTVGESFDPEKHESGHVQVHVQSDHGSTIHVTVDKTYDGMTYERPEHENMNEHNKEYLSDTHAEDHDHAMEMGHSNTELYEFLTLINGKLDMIIHDVAYLYTPNQQNDEHHQDESREIHEKHTEAHHFDGDHHPSEIQKADHTDVDHNVEEYHNTIQTGLTQSDIKQHAMEHHDEHTDDKEANHRQEEPHWFKHPGMDHSNMSTYETNHEHDHHELTNLKAEQFLLLKQINETMDKIMHAVGDLVAPLKMEHSSVHVDVHNDHGSNVHIIVNQDDKSYDKEGGHVIKEGHQQADHHEEERHEPDHSDSNHTQMEH